MTKATDLAAEAAADAATGSNRYLVNELNTKDDPFELLAESVEVDEQSGKIKFLDTAGNLVGLFINATFRKLTDSDSDK